MDIIFSSANFQKKHFGMANLANFFAQKQGYKTTLYCTKDDLDTFKKMPFNEIKLLPEKTMNEIPDTLWSMSKIVALSMIDKPSLLIDLDTFLFKPLREDRLNSDVIYLHDEPYSAAITTPLLSWCEEVKFPKIKHLHSDLSNNCAIIGGQNYELIKSVAKEIVELVIENKEKWTNLCSKEQESIFSKKYYPGRRSETFFIPVLIIEQIWMFDLFKVYDKNVSIKPYYDRADDLYLKFFSEEIFHLWGLKKPMSIAVCRDFSETVADYDTAYEDFNFDFSFLKEVRKLTK